MYSEALLFGAYSFLIDIKIFLVDIFQKVFSLWPLVIFFALEFTLSDIDIATVTFLD